jgi:hypothetical protein
LHRTPLLNRPILLLVVACLSAATVTPAAARVRHRPTPSDTTQWYQASTGAVFVGGTYAGSDPDPNIRGALAREFGKRR